MKKQFLTLFIILSGLLLWGCYPEGAEYVEDVDVVMTNYNDTYDFTTKGTYAIPDKMVYIEVDGGRFKQRTYTNKVGQKITTIGGRHNSGKGFEDDCEKKNTASVLGWRGLTVFPETLLTNKTFEMVMDCCKINL